MASAYVAENSDHLLSGLIVAGCRNNGGRPLSCKENLEEVDIPVLDIWGGKNDKDAIAAYYREELASEKYQQMKVSGVNHSFDDYEGEFVSSVVSWLKKQ